jgi:hypothetical protein
MNDEPLEGIEAQRSLMIAVATGGPAIKTVEADYEARRYEIRKALDALGLKDPNPFDSLWMWYGKWSSGDLPSYQSRRMFVYELYAPLLEQIRALGRGVTREVEPTGWTRVDRGIDEARNRLATAQNEEQYQAVGHLCREILISPAQTVFDPELHPTLDGVAASATDASVCSKPTLATRLAAVPTKQAVAMRGQPLTWRMKCSTAARPLSEKLRCALKPRLRL